MEPDDSRKLKDHPSENQALKQNGVKVKASAPKLAAWVETAIPKFRPVLQLPVGLRKRFRISNGPYAHQPENPAPLQSHWLIWYRFEVPATVIPILDRVQGCMAVWKDYREPTGRDNRPSMS